MALDDGWTEWARVRRAGLLQFIETASFADGLAPHWPVRGSKCR
ncbi:hypothetical protein OHT93_36960 [Streptomyces sp. NBC_00191]